MCNHLLAVYKIPEVHFGFPFQSSVECERGFSRQNQIKTKNRNLLITNTLDIIMRTSLVGLIVMLHISLKGPESFKFDYNRAFTIYRAFTIWNNQKRHIDVKK